LFGALRGGGETTGPDAEAATLGSPGVTALFATREATSRGDSGAAFEEPAPRAPIGPLGPSPIAAGLDPRPPVVVGPAGGIPNLGSLLGTILPPIFRGMDNLGIDLRAVFRSLLRFMVVPRSVPGQPAGREADGGALPPAALIGEDGGANQECRMIVLV